MVSVTVFTLIYMFYGVVKIRHRLGLLGFLCMKSVSLHIHSSIHHLV